MADLATAYLLLVPSLKGAKGTIEKELGGATKGAGKSAGDALGEDMGEGLMGKIGGIASNAAKALAGAFAAKKVFDFGHEIFDAFADFEQLEGGVQKIFDDMDTSKIMADANNAWLDLNMSANEYMETINQVGSMFSQTMGDEKGYEVARTGMKAVSDYATGTGRDLDQLNEKFAMITRSTSSYQSIADQFAGVLPATSKDFLEQAQAAGLLSDSYEQLTDVPVAEYQQAISGMLEKGVADLGLANNTANEALGTLSGSILATKSAWQNLVTELGKPDADIGARISDMLTAVMGKDGEGGLLRNVTAEVKVIAQNLIGAAKDGISSAAAWLATNAPKMLSGGITKALDVLGSMTADGSGALGIVENVSNAVSGIRVAIADRMPEIVSAATQLLAGIGTKLVNDAPKLLKNVGRSIARAIRSGMSVSADLIGGVADLFQQITSAIYVKSPSIMAAAAKALKGIGTAALNMAPVVLGALGKLLGNVASFLLEKAPLIASDAITAFAGLADGAAQQGPKILEGLQGLIGGIVQWFTTHGPIIKENALKAFENIKNALMEHGPSILASIGSVLGTIGQAILDNGPTLLARASEILLQLLEWVTSHGPELVSKVAEVVGNVIEAAKAWLIENGPAILEAAKTAFMGLVNAIKEHGPTILANIAQTIGSVISHVAAAATRLLAAGVKFFGGLITGTSDEGKKLHEWFANLPQTLLDAMGDLGSFLLDAGKQILEGFWKGLKEKWDEVTGWIGDIGGWIAEHKGPKQYDLGLLVPAGGWIMEGLQEGLTDGMPALGRTITGIGDQIRSQVGDAVSGATMPVSVMMSDALGQAYDSRRPALPSIPRGGAATSGTGWSEVAGAVSALRGDMSSIGMYVDGDKFVGAIRTRMDRALVM